MNSHELFYGLFGGTNHGPPKTQLYFQAVLNVLETYLEEFIRISYVHRTIRNC